MAMRLYWPKKKQRRQVDRTACAAGEVITQPINHPEFLTMKTTHSVNLLAAALAASLTLTSAHAADLTPAETKAIAEKLTSTVCRS